MTEFKINDKVKIQKRGENSGFVEVGRGTVIATANGKFGQWIKYLERDVENADCGEWFNTVANNIKVIRW
jgi:hypothetical protein